MAECRVQCSSCQKAHDGNECVGVEGRPGVEQANPKEKDLGGQLRLACLDREPSAEQLG